MAGWGELEAAGGDLGGLAARVRARFESSGLGFLATLRLDGSPRITGIEPFFGLGELWLGSMPGARKGADLRRDGRLALHAATIDKEVNDGDAKIAGRAVLVGDLAVHAAVGELLAAGGGEHPEPGTYDLFRVVLDELGFLHPEADHLVIEWWNELAGYRRVERVYDEGQTGRGGPAGTVAPVRVGVLASGSGTILEAILTDGIAVEVVVVDRRCGAAEVAERHGVPAELVERTDFSSRFDRAAYSQQVVDVLRKYDVGLVVSAGFGTVVPSLATAYPGRFLNTHPALLPAFKGWHAVRDALAAGVKITGCTVHLADEATDEGTILAQEAVPVLPDDTEATLHERIKQVERRLVPATIRQLLEGKQP